MDEITMRGGTGHEVETHDVGSRTDEIRFVEGAYDVERENGRTFRWFEPTFTLQFPGWTDFSFTSGMLTVSDTSQYDSAVGTTTCARTNGSKMVEPNGWHELNFSFHPP